MRVLRFRIVFGQWVVDKMEGDFRIRNFKGCYAFSLTVLKTRSGFYVQGDCPRNRSKGNQQISDGTGESSPGFPALKGFAYQGSTTSIHFPH